MAGNKVTLSFFRRFRPDLSTDFIGKGAAGMKTTPGRRIQRAGHVPFKNHTFFLLRTPAQAGDTRKKKLCVRMKRLGIEFRAGSHFHKPAQIHHRYSVADVLYHAQVMSDKKVT